VKPFKIVLIALFIVFSAIEIYAAFTNRVSLKFVSTPTLMPLLALFYLSSVSKRNWFIVAALIFSLLGDVLNQWQSDENIFMIETGAFLVALVCYIIALSQPISHFKKVPVAYYALLIVYIAYGIFIYSVLNPFLGDMRLPAIIYLTIVLIMSFSALTRIVQYRGYSFWLPFIGTLVFIASDTFLAVNAFKYNGQMKYGDFLTTIFYIPAQVLIVLGLMPKNEATA
jgi:uncharacterized membrane protein YhhN